MNARPYPEPDPTPPACGPTVALIQAVLDGDRPAAALDADVHADGCPTCRGRVRSARLLLAVYPARPANPAVPSGLTDAILAGVRADRRKRVLRPWAGAAAGLAAAVAVVVWSPWNPTADRPDVLVERPPVVEPPPVRVAAELAKAGDALKEGSLAWVEPAAAAPKLFAALTESVAAPIVPPPPEVEPVRQSLAELPDAARAGLEPVAGSARKAWDRLLRDVGAVAAKPKS
jgi:hypothetical protein